MQENAGVQVSERPEAKERGAGVASGHKDSVVCGCLSATPIVIGVLWPLLLARTKPVGAYSSFHPLRHTRARTRGRNIQK
jgi:hypothetical protein